MAEFSTRTASGFWFCRTSPVRLGYCNQAAPIHDPRHRAFHWQAGYVRRQIPGVVAEADHADAPIPGNPKRPSNGSFLLILKRDKALLQFGYGLDEEAGAHGGPVVLRAVEKVPEEAD